jgi:hypothetical protein
MIANRSPNRSVRRPLPFALTMVVLAGCSTGSGSHSQSTSGSQDGSSNTAGDDGGSANPSEDGAVPSNGADAGGASDAHATADAKGTTTNVDGGDAPAGQTGANAYCAAICDREAMCLSVAFDASTCHCSAGTLILYRSDYVAKLAACESGASCEDLLSDAGVAADSGLGTCAETALAQITPTTAVNSLCSQIGLSACPGDVVPDCPATFKVYGDQTVNAVSACIADSNCNDHAACVTTALTP